MDKINYSIVDDIKIFDGTIIDSHEEFKNRINFLKTLIQPEQQLFTPLQPSTLTAQGLMSNISFNEQECIKTLSKPSDHILMIGCNYGEIIHPKFKKPIEKKISSRGRKPKPRKIKKRKTQGNGKYFSSQITFLIEHPDPPHNLYKIKLFRNGVFQVPGILNPDMGDLVKPIKILRDYLAHNFNQNVQIMNFMAVMRNYKCALTNPFYHVDLERLEELLFKEKIDVDNENFLNYMLRDISYKYREKIKDIVGNFNPMNIAEMTYNTDRCFCLIIKFYRPNILDAKKKTTIKLLKKGKINFDGGNSQQEIDELYYWLQYIYVKYQKEILFDIRTMFDETDTSECSQESIYDDPSLQVTSKRNIRHNSLISKRKPLKKGEKKNQ